MRRPSLRAFGSWRGAPYARVGLWILAFLVGLRLQLRLESLHAGARELLLLALAGALIAAAAWPWRPDVRADIRRADDDEALRPANWRAIALPVLLLAAAVVLGLLYRIYDLGERPVGISFDEAQNGLIARNILDGKRPPMFIGGFTQLPSAFFYVYAASMRIVGEDVISLRLVSTIGGLLALPLLFICARELFGLRVAAIAVLLLAVMRWHVNFSRFGVTNIFAATFVTGAVAFFARGIRGGARWNFVVSGLFVGMTPYAGFYGIFVPFVLGLYWLHSAIFDRVLDLRQHLVSIVIVAGVAMLLYAPVAVWGTLNGDEYLSRPGTASIFKNKTREEAFHAVRVSARKHLLMFNAKGDQNGRHNLPHAPMLDRVTGILFLLGLGIAASRLHRSAFFLLIAWVLVFMQNGIWSVDFEAPQAFRTSAVTPAVAMIAALPLGALWALSERASAAMRAEGGGLAARVGSVAAPACALIIVGGLLATAAWRNFDRYFNEQLDHPQVWRDWNTDIALVARELRDADPDERVLMSSLLSSPVIDFVDHDTVDRTAYQIDLQRDLPLSEPRATLILLDSTKSIWVDWIKLLYPSAQVTEFAPPGLNAPAQAYRILIPKESAAGLLGLDAIYIRPGEPPVSRREAVLNVDWSQQPPPLPVPFQARWTGAIRVRELTGTALRVVAPGEIILNVDGEEVARGRDDITWPGPLVRGLHTIDIEADVERAGAVRLMTTSSIVGTGDNFAGDPVKQMHGLTATFYTGGDFAGEPVLMQIDPFVAFRYHAELPFTGPFSVIWEGQLRVTEQRTYAFRLEPTGEASLSIDGREIIPFPGTAEGKIELGRGLYDIKVRYRNTTGYAGIFLRWDGGIGNQAIVPPTSLVP